MACPKHIIGTVCSERMRQYHWCRLQKRALSRQTWLGRAEKMLLQANALNQDGASGLSGCVPTSTDIACHVGGS